MMSQILGQHMRLEQRLTPQLIQSMDILQLSTQALEARLTEELEKNVTLEIVDVSEKPAGEDGANPPPVDASDGPQVERFSRLDSFSRENGLDADDRVQSRSRIRRESGERDAKMDAMANTASRQVGIDEYLLQQWNLLDLDDETRRAGEAIIYHLDEDGFLRTGFEQISVETRPPVGEDALERALGHVQRLDPIGIAARDYKECLLLQLEAMPGDNTIERVIIAEHLDNIVRNRYPAIAKATGYSVGEITAAVEAIRTMLVLQPAYLVVDKRIPRIFPDVVVEEDPHGKGFIVRMTRGNLPEIRIKPEFLEMTKSKKNGKDVRDYVRKQVENGHALIEAVKFRNSRLQEVAEAVVRYQADFFDVGAAGLKVLRMSDLAEEFGCDPSTISRAVADKYVQTLYGIYPLRYFFTGGTGSSSGNGASNGWESIKTKMADIVRHEDVRNPLNDDQIAAALAKENITISRRTVAKYRAQLDIPSARQRKKF